MNSCNHRLFMNKICTRVDVIIEIACIITDGELQVVEKGIDLIIHQVRESGEIHGLDGMLTSNLEQISDGFDECMVC